MNILHALHRRVRVVAAHAIPPDRDPPSYAPAKALATLLWVAASTGAVAVADAVTTGLVRASPATSAAVQWAVLALIGVAFVARVTLGRTTCFVSRYGDCFELVRVALVLPIALWCGPATPASEIESAFGAEHLQHILVRTVLPYFAALHFTYLDASTTLQSLGCKLPLPSRWSTLNAPECGALAVLVALVAPALASLVPAAWAHADQSAWPVARSYLYLLAASLIASGSELPVPACLRRSVGSHTNDQPSEIFLHVHHYLQGLMLVPWTCHASASGQIAFAVGLGVWIEGAFGVSMLLNSLAFLTTSIRPFPARRYCRLGYGSAVCLGTTAH